MAPKAESTDSLVSVLWQTLDQTVGAPDVAAIEVRQLVVHKLAGAVMGWLASGVAGGEVLVLIDDVVQREVRKGGPLSGPARAYCDAVAAETP